MTEEEWLVCEKPDLLLRHLKGIGATRWHRGQRRRKLRLLGCAAFGQARHLLHPEYGQRAIEVAERYADGVAELAELQQLNQELRVAKVEMGTPQWAAEQAVTILLSDNDLTVAELALDYSLWGVEHEATPTKPNLFRKALRRAQTVLVRDIFGNPFTPYPAPPHWPAAVVQLAEAIYNGADSGFALQDALLEAGHPELAEHFQKETWHPKGCWVVVSERPNAASHGRLKCRHFGRL